MRTPPAADVLLVGAVKLAVSALVLGQGFRAVSDDDYARMVIAQRFAESPSLDPSGTSWLPAPFWTYGSSFALFGNGLGVARTTALVLGVAASLLLLVAARWLGAGRVGALLAALAASVFPWSRWLGAAALPEAPAAGLVVLGMASLLGLDRTRRSIGASALALACFCRYEAWPVAAVFCVFAAVDARRSRSWLLAVPAVVAVLPIVLWLAHGVVRHDDALFFWKRVASYKHALGSDSSPVLAMTEPLVALVREELLLVAVAGLAVVRRARTGAPLAPYLRGAVCSSALVMFLCVGAFGGGTPTHHAARALLPAWYFLALVLGHAAGPSFESLSRKTQALLVGAATLVVFDPSTLTRLPSDFARRDLELYIGDRARRLNAPALLVDTSDFGYFAVAAAFGRPGASMPLDDRDPRKPRRADAFASVESLRERLGAVPNTWLVASDTHASIARELGVVRASNAGFVLVEPR